MEANGNAPEAGKNTVPENNSKNSTVNAAPTNSSSKVTLIIVIVLLVLAGLIAAALIRRHGPDRRDWIYLILFLLGIGIVIGMEFAKDKLPALPIWSCYAIMAAASAMMGIVTWRLVFRRPETQP